MKISEIDIGLLVTVIGFVVSITIFIVSIKASIGGVGEKIDSLENIMNEKFKVQAGVIERLERKQEESNRVRERVALLEQSDKTQWHVIDEIKAREKQI